MKKKNFVIIILFSIVSSYPLYSQEIPTEENRDSIQVQEVVDREDVIRQQGIFKRDTAVHELHLNILNVLVFGALDVAYERILTDHSSVGVELFTKVFNKNAGEKGDLSKIYAKDYSITTKFKYFLDDETVARGYYANVFGMFSNGTNEVNLKFPNSETGELETKEVDMEYTDLAFGVGVGGKFVARQGFLVDVSFGIGRNLFDKYSPDIVILPSVYLGYRF